MVRWLSARGLDPDASASEAPPPLVVAIRRGNMDLVALLLEVGASPQLADRMGNSPLLLAVSAGMEPAVKLLLARGVDVDRANARGTTSLDVARREGYSAIIALLEARGAKRGAFRPAPTGSYLGQTPPAAIPEMFGAKFVSTEKRELNASFSPDGRELFFARERVPLRPDVR